MRPYLGGTAGGKNRPGPIGGKKAGAKDSITPGANRSGLHCVLSTGLELCSRETCFARNTAALGKW